MISDNPIFSFAEKYIIELSIQKPRNKIKNETSVIKRENTPLPSGPVKRAIVNVMQNCKNCCKTRINMFPVNKILKWLFKLQTTGLYFLLL